MTTFGIIGYNGVVLEENHILLVFPRVWFVVLDTIVRSDLTGLLEILTKYFLVREGFGVGLGSADPKPFLFTF